MIKQGQSKIKANGNGEVPQCKMQEDDNSLNAVNSKTEISKTLSNNQSKSSPSLKRPSRARNQRVIDTKNSKNKIINN
jgi:hypothetical protein